MGPSVATTGIAGLDAQLGGGNPRGSTILVMGEPGNALPLFSEQFTGGGLDSGDDAQYFVFDRPVAGMRDAVQNFIMRGNEKKSQLTLHDGYSPQFGKGLRTRDANALPVPLSAAMATILGTLQNQTPARPYRLVVESLSALTRDGNEREVVDFVRNVVYLGQELGGLHLLSLVKGLHTPEFEAQLRHLCTGVIEFGAERKGFGIYNYLIVTKLLGVRDPVKILLWKETDKGLWFESTKRVF